jgi:hypothetical protein
MSIKKDDCVHFVLVRFFMAKINSSQRHLMTMTDYGAADQMTSAGGDETSAALRVSCVTCELALNETEASSPFYRHQVYKKFFNHEHVFVTFVLCHDPQQ